MGFWFSALEDWAHFSASLSFDLDGPQEQACPPPAASALDPSGALHHFGCFQVCCLMLWLQPHHQGLLLCPLSGAALCYLPSSVSGKISMVVFSPALGCPNLTTCEAGSSHHFLFEAWRSALCFWISLKTPKQNQKCQSCLSDTRQAQSSSPGCTCFPRTRRHHRQGSGSRQPDRTARCESLPGAASDDLPMTANSHQARSSLAHT